jgi:cation:H+ antiporter
MVSVVEGKHALEWFDLAVSLVIILISAELFTNGIEWVGENFGLSEGAVGSVLAAVGTALPETILPLVAILLGSQEAGEQIGVGAILGAPFMLSTLAMFVTGVAVLVAARGGRRKTDVVGNRRVILQDLGYFLVMYLLATVAGLWHPKWFKWTLVAVLLAGYVVYVIRHFRAPDDHLEEVAGEIRPLYLGRLTTRVLGKPAGNPGRTPTWASIVQTLVALVGIVLGARLFVDGIDLLARTFNIPPLVLALLIAPVATELPEKFNSVIWVTRRKDTLALGNITGAMVFQSSFPVSIGLLMTPWRLSGDSLIAAIVALAAGTILWVTLKVRGSFAAKGLLLQGVLFAGFAVFVVVRL